MKTYPASMYGYAPQEMMFISPNGKCFPIEHFTVIFVDTRQFKLGLLKLLSMMKS